MKKKPFIVKLWNIANIIVLVAILLSIIETAIFGFNWKPQSANEVLWDSIITFIFQCGFICYMYCIFYLADREIKKLNDENSN